MSKISLNFHKYHLSTKTIFLFAYQKDSNEAIWKCMKSILTWKILLNNFLTSNQTKPQAQVKLNLYSRKSLNCISNPITFPMPFSTGKIFLIEQKPLLALFSRRVVKGSNQLQVYLLNMHIMQVDGAFNCI